jgi:hypothetical protein
MFPMAAEGIAMCNIDWISELQFGKSVVGDMYFYCLCGEGFKEVKRAILRR